MAENTTLISLHERITGLAIYGDYIAVTGVSFTSSLPLGQ